MKKITITRKHMVLLKTNKFEKQKKILVQGDSSSKIICERSGEAYGWGNFFSKV